MQTVTTLPTMVCHQGSSLEHDLTFPQLDMPPPMEQKSEILRAKHGLAEVSQS